MELTLLSTAPSDSFLSSDTLRRELLRGHVTDEIRGRGIQRKEASNSRCVAEDSEKYAN